MLQTCSKKGLAARYVESNKTFVSRQGNVECTCRLQNCWMSCTWLSPLSVLCIGWWSHHLQQNGIKNISHFSMPYFNTGRCGGYGLLSSAAVSDTIGRAAHSSCQHNTQWTASDKGPCHWHHCCVLFCWRGLYCESNCEYRDFRWRVLLQVVKWPEKEKCDKDFCLRRSSQRRLIYLTQDGWV
jgi:hypothetical protein